MWEKTKILILALTMLVVLASCVLAWTSNQVSVDIWGWVRRFIQVESALHLPACVTLVAGGLCYARTRRGGILWVAIAFALVDTIVIALLNDPPAWLATRSPGYIVVRLGEYLSRTSVAVPLMVILSVRLRVGWDRLRWVLLASMSAQYLCEVGVTLCAQIPSLSRTLWLYRLAEVGQMLTLWLTILSGATLAWALAFKQVPSSQPPTDAHRTMGFTCPRCGLPQEMTLPAGQCSGCQLQLYVALNEGRCAQCGYALRGLTGDKCPECGTPLAVATVVDPII